MADTAAVSAIEWRDGRLRLLDQRGLPDTVAYVECTDALTVRDAIAQMVVRGAPAIGIAAAYGLLMSARARARNTPQSWREALAGDAAALVAARPTAVNLRWAVERMLALAAASEPEGALGALADEAERIHRDDVAANRTMGALGAELIAPGSGVLTHCNAGALATGGYGTALGVIRAAFAAGKLRGVYADETRPWLQGARLTAWELEREGIPVSVITDAAASYAMRQRKVDWVIVGADRIAANGDVANKIGTYSLAVSARHHGVGFMVAAPTSTVDLSTARGDDIAIEMRAEEEILSIAGRRVAAPGVGAWNPVFDVTPADLVDVLVTERGVVHRPDAAKLRALMTD